MINLRFLLGLFPKTSVIEAKEAVLLKEFNELESFKQSDELKLFFDLKKFVESSEFKSKELEIKAINYKTSVEFKKESEYQQLAKSARITNYYKVLSSPQYKNYVEVTNSAELAQYSKLKETIESSEFKKNETQVKALNYKGSTFFNSEQEYNKLKNAKEIKNHFKVITTEGFKLYNLLHDSDDLKHFLNLKSFAESDKGKNLYAQMKKAKDFSDPELEKLKEYDTLKQDTRYSLLIKFEASPECKLYLDTLKSGKIEKFEQLGQFLNSDEFKKNKGYLSLSPAKRWEQTNEYQISKEFETLKTNSKIKDYLKFSVSKEFLLFQEIEKTNEIKAFEELKAYVTSDSFAEAKKYMLLTPKVKWEQTEEFAKQKEYIALLNSEKVKWYFKVADSKKFDELKAWQLTFSDEFDASTLDTSKWLTRFFWGDSLLNDSFSLSDDLHFNTDGKNILLENSILKIETRKEQVTGKAWNPLFGFIPKEFEYTSGIINTGKSFRQKYGRFKTKIKMSSSSSLTSAFWMVGNQIMPHIDVAKFQNNALNLNYFWGNIAQKDGVNKSPDKLGAGRLKNDFFIFELEWTPKELIWKINGLELKRVTNSLPDEPMYLQFSCGVNSNQNLSGLPSSMEIDWVRCFTHAE